MLGKLKKIDLRTEWKHEAHDFTNWLAQTENLELLSEAIGIDIKLVQTEAKVGNFNVDILAEEENTGKCIIIENQLETTNHDHLGKLITYAAGHEAEYIIWIIREMREEHRHAIDWLNEHTDEKTNFFAVEVELWQIGESPYAPKFNVLSRPNDWAKAVKESVGEANLSDTKLLQLEFWNKFKEYATKNKTKLRLRTPRPHHWYNISVGSSEAHVALTINTQKNVFGCELYISKNKELYHALAKFKDAIEKEIGHKLEWMELESSKASRIKLSREGDIEESQSWEEYFNWLNKTAETFLAVFSKYIKIANQ